MAYDPMEKLRTSLTGCVADARPLEDLVLVKDKVALVTGGSSGLGFDIVLRLLQGGAKVIIVSNVKEQGDVALPVLEEAGYADRAEFVAADITKEEDVEGLIKYVDEKYGTLDIYVNSVGIWSYAHLYDMPKEEFERVMTINVNGVFLCLKHVSKYMVEHEIKGKIVAISSNCAWYPYPVFGGYPHYAASKGAINAMIVEAAKELKRYDISVNCVAPGGMMTPGATTNLAARGLTDDQEDQIYEEMSLTAGAGAQTIDGVGMAAYMLCTGAADEITGECLVADNGVSHNIFRFQPAAERYPELD